MKVLNVLVNDIAFSDKMYKVNGKYIELLHKLDGRRNWCIEVYYKSGRDIFVTCLYIRGKDAYKHIKFTK